jgi:hypothetical protein
MLNTLIDRARSFFRAPDTPESPPPQRLGCVDVDVFATPRDGDDVTFLRRVRELKQLQAAGREPTTTLVDYFADRYDDRSIGDVVGCPFRVYLERPLIVEELYADLS